MHQKKKKKKIKVYNLLEYMQLLWMKNGKW